MVINCAGAWAGEVAKMAGIGDETKGNASPPLPVEPRFVFYVFNLAYCMYTHRCVYNKLRQCRISNWDFNTKKLLLISFAHECSAFTKLRCGVPIIRHYHSEVVTASWVSVFGSHSLHFIFW